MEGFPDVEDALCEILEPIAATVTETGPDLVTPVIQVNRTGTAAASAIQETAIVEVACFGEKRPDSVTLNNQVRDRLSDARGEETSFGFIDKIAVNTNPVPTFDPNPDVRKQTSTWLVTSRLQDLP